MSVTIQGAPTTPVASGSQFTITAKGAEGADEIPQHAELLRIEGTVTLGEGEPQEFSVDKTITVAVVPEEPDEMVHIDLVTWVDGGGAVGTIVGNDTNAPHFIVTVP